MKKIFAVAVLWISAISFGQSAWPSVNWSAADNLTSVMNANGITDLSGLHWNYITNRLYCVQGDGRLRILQMDDSAMGFGQIANKVLLDGPEGVTQVDLSADEFYTIDENSYEIRKFTHNSAFGSMAETRHWDLLAWPSPMEDTGNTGPEGIVFISDAALSAAGFISAQTGNLYTSVKGMGGLMFIAHQNEGYIWVFDLNPNVNNDFLFVGKYRTSRLESADLAFDESTGLLYILHNVGGNYLEVTNLSTEVIAGERRFASQSEYFIANPDGENVNIEGFAIMPKCPAGNTSGVWLARDVESDEDDDVLQDVLRWFSPFAADGNCVPLSVPEIAENRVVVYPNPGNERVTILAGDELLGVRIYNILGQPVLTRLQEPSQTFDVSPLPPGLYFIEVLGSGSAVVKWIKD